MTTDSNASAVLADGRNYAAVADVTALATQAIATQDNFSSVYEGFYALRKELRYVEDSPEDRRATHYRLVHFAAMAIKAARAIGYDKEV
jgi:hypothetical protein